ncbi:MAG: hypothetical protein WAV09_01895 [Minisyncoccia bacterium]
MIQAVRVSPAQLEMAQQQRRLRTPAVALQVAEERRRIKIKRWMFGWRVLRLATTFIVVAGVIYLFSRTMIG